MDFTNPVYTDEDIIESRDDKRVSSLVGKKVYSSWSKEICLYRANHNYIDLQQDLLRVDPDNTIAPFAVRLPIYKHDDVRNVITEPVSINTPYIIGVKESN